MAIKKKNDIDSLSLLKKILHIASETKAIDMNAIDLKGKSSLCDYLLFLSARSQRQVQGIANNITDILSKEGLKNFSMEGFLLGDWILIDFGDVIVHVFQDEVRAHYDLESLYKKQKSLQINQETGEINA